MKLSTASGTAAPDIAALLEIWVAGWAAARLCASPTADRGGWRVEVNWPLQVRRHVFAGVSDALRELGETIVEPWVYLKACTTADELRALLPPRWTVQAPSFFMIFDALPPAPPRLPDGYGLSLAEETGVQVARIHAADGTPAAEGHLVTVKGAAIFDRIATHPAHRRRGLGRAIMCALHAVAIDRQATPGLLAATLDGHALYTALGWRVLSPYASAVIVHS